MHDDDKKLVMQRAYEAGVDSFLIGGKVQFKKIVANYKKRMYRVRRFRWKLLLI